MATNDRPRFEADGRPPSARLGARYPPVPAVVEVVIDGPIAPADVPALCDRARFALERSGKGRLVCDVSALLRPDAVTVEALARVQLTARRLGARMWLRDACGDLRDLLEFVGLGGVLPCTEPSGLETRGQAEQREQALGVEEEADPGDRPV